MMVIRPIHQDDLKSLYRLAEKTGIGFTSLIADEESLQRKIDKATGSFNKDVIDKPNDEDYLMVLEDTDTGDIVGTTGLLGAVGLDEPFYSYHLGTITHSSRELGVHNIMPTLVLNNDFTGFSEICTLFLEEDYRHSKNGQLLSKSRFMFLAQFSERFTDKIFAEMRGICDENGVSPLWESLGRHFFSIDFERADELTALGSKQFIAELMPNNPVYVNLLTPEARNVLGKVHKNTVPARHLLEQEGFRYENYVDIFDGGPTLEARVRDIRAVRDSRLYLATIGEVKEAGTGTYYLVANVKLADYRCILIQRPTPPHGGIVLTEEEAKHLLVEPKDPVRVVELSPHGGY
ncbi:Arginine N-succinyltransferase [Marinomonas spartinae]|uniref:Arginine N-succinyltransferase n=1 Tax=Marinomonas spartinae TaxID=1792290 RepID=A0A1A8T662_9GAMM|nr:arginine N-succinyltransferase [Marinomonas spartinae]SBS27124.1 Arginine N-succinyltransferase [Marinomonas spartinae]SBS35939.1 Arginine N-succinyltransferase [Marinomonas spartinae]